MGAEGLEIRMIVSRFGKIKFIPFQYDWVVRTKDHVHEEIMRQDSYQVDGALPCPFFLEHWRTSMLDSTSA